MREEIAIKLKGDIDHHSSPRLRASLDKLIETKRPKRLILDFENVTLMDSSGIGLIIGRYKTLREWGGELCVRNTCRQTDAVFRVSGIYKIIRKVR